MYVDAQQENDIIHVIERVDGQRIYKEFPADYHLYITDPKGSHKSIYGDAVKKLMPKSKAERTKIIKTHRSSQLWESDINVVSRCLEQEYLGKDFPKLQVAFYDIETDFDKEFGYCTPAEASNPIISIAVYLQWLKQMVCIAVPPKGMSLEEANNIAAEVGNVIIVETEAEMLDMFLTLIEDADILSGWNCEYYDRTFTINRITKILGKHESRRMCLWNKLPKKKSIERGGKDELIYETVGRISLDYMQLYKKYNYEERHSYSLDNIARAELGSQKVPYDGTLDQLYNKDFKLFLEYNIQDTMLLNDLDKKLQYIDLASAIAHGNAVLIPATMGAVATTEQAIICEAHSRNMVVPDKKRSSGNGDDLDGKAAGGWVSHPKKGLHKWVGSSDLNSLYPSVIRALNMSNETMVGQIRTAQTNAEITEWCNRKGTVYTFASWWNDRFSTVEMENFFGDPDRLDKSDKLYLDMVNGETYEVTSAELYALIFQSNKPWCISANGTIFTTSKEGVIPGLLRRWYSERKIMQKIARSYNSLQSVNPSIDIDTSLFVEDAAVTCKTPFNADDAYKIDALQKLIDSGNAEDVSYYMNTHNLHVIDGKVRYKDIDHLAEIVDYWDKRQLVRKILLNSIYGGLLNEHMRFFDQRIGQSTTLTGRSITKHMTAKTNEILTGEYDHAGMTAIYNDTDSCYFSVYPVVQDQIKKGELEWTAEKAIKLYDAVSDEVSNTFPIYMNSAFNVPHKLGEVIASGREIVAETGLFIKKKRYAALVTDDEGVRKDVDGKPGKIKAMGLDLRRADTPSFVQEFLLDILTKVLTGSTENDIIKDIREFKEKFNTMSPWERGIPKGVNKLTYYKQQDELEMQKRASGRGATKGFTVPGHVRGALNWNMLIDKHNDLHSPKILDGSKVIVCYLSNTADNNMSVIAYPVDVLKLPDWFTSLPFDTDRLEDALIDKKVTNLLSVLNWDLSRTDVDIGHMETLFDFSSF